MIRLLLLLLLSSCNLGPTLVGPVVPIPENWKEETASTEGTSSPDRWWEVFEDETLDRLELDAIAASPDLESALYRMEQAWAEAGVTEADLFPQLSLQPNYSSSGTLFKLFRPPGFDNILSTKPYRVHILNYSLPLNLSYELDLWGRLRKEAEAGILSAEAAHNAYFTSLLSLTSQVASSYFNLRLLTTLVAITQDEIFQRTKAVRYYEERYKKGISNLLDFESESIELANLNASLSELQKQSVLETNKLAMLIGRVPSEVFITPSFLTEPPPMIPAGIPSDILLNRPDVLQAERKRASENARVGAAWASFFPSFSLTAGLGFLSPTTADFLQWQSRLWTYGANVDQTIFDGFRKCSNYKLAWARFDEADANYRQTVIQAFREVEDALSSLRYEREKVSAYKDALDSAQKALVLSQRRFDTGLVTSLEVIDKERSSLQARLNSASSLGNTYQATIQLIKALGASWTLFHPFSE